eukprot:CAMPEP_0169164334 /NCGR_PEP_ID=MMETSP1015-20121227/58784_1 /TAXON_ID=342587 /ORGANISM="Karlodinium micrum, Strain CCMP2283" /LENGTH=113 /DNA_ID=CAMNT_0009236773 /DNA_START=1115 /DNA_END=1454 /DNA_ORIENTATION=+
MCDSSPNCKCDSGPTSKYDKGVGRERAMCDSGPTAECNNIPTLAHALFDENGVAKAEPPLQQVRVSGVTTLLLGLIVASFMAGVVSIWFRVRHLGHARADAVRRQIELEASPL